MNRTAFGLCMRSKNATGKPLFHFCMAQKQNKPEKGLDVFGFTH
jgi:hypothetical protein